jgi:RNA polymerase sigma-70 factor (ECF subfamily)
MMSSRKQTGDEARVIRWVTEHADAVRGYVLGLVRRSELAEDFVQEVFRRAWQARGRYQEQGSPRAYLLRIADHLVCDQGRRGQREITLDGAEWSELVPVNGAGAPGDSLLQDESRAALAAALDALSEPQRRVLLLRYYGEMSFEEIAATLDCPLNTALSHCRRGLLALRKIMTASEA